MFAPVWLLPKADADPARICWTLWEDTCLLVVGAHQLAVPHRAPQASACGCLDATLELMQVLLASNGTSSGGGNGKENRATAVQRQACMAIRNAAVRCAP